MDSISYLMNFYRKTLNFVNKVIPDEQKAHFERTVFWMEKFSPIFTEAHRIAAYCHDIERAFNDKKNEQVENYLDPAFLKDHQEKSAEIISNFLKSENAPKDLIDKISHLISKHEVGGDEEQNALMDADSVSFFETNARMFIVKKAPVEGYEKIKEKFDWMFNRICSEDHKHYARINYKKWLAELEYYR